MSEIHSTKNNLKIYPFTWIARRLLFIYMIVTLSFFDALSQKYFQQEVNYKINVSLNDTLHELRAFEKMEYINHSPDTLHFIWFHLWPNAYSNNSTPLAKQVFRVNGKSKLFDNPELSGFIDSLDFKVNGRQVQWNLLPGQPDICRI
ncbi:MAG: M1 family metallopeptidase, partial [Bacteroidales bacterium]|nr:M1 family metallopeptidase [Bacteroidales bacterium]